MLDVWERVPPSTTKLFGAALLEQLLYTLSESMVVTSIFHPHPATPNRPESRFATDITSVEIAFPEMSMCPAVTSLKIEG